jgi:hypothetical protein
MTDTADDQAAKQQTWVEADPKIAGRLLFDYGCELDRRNTQRLRNWEIFAAVFDEQLEVNLRQSQKRNLLQPAATRNANVTYNVAASLVETAHATVSEAEPRPVVLTEDGNRPLQDKARELQRAIDGLMGDLRGYEKMDECDIDKLVFGTSCTKVHEMGGRPAVDRVLISDMLIDEEILGSDQEPKAAIHRIEIARLQLLTAMEKANAPANILEAIKKAPAIATATIEGERADLICLMDGYSQAFDEETPGRHGMAIENCEELIFVEEWDKPYLPFVFQWWQRPRKGFYGIGVVEQVIGVQVSINRFYRNVDRALKRWGVPIALIPTISKIDLQKWTNNPDGIFVPFDPAGGGGSPVFFNGNILSPEVIPWLREQIDFAHRRTGIPQNVAWAQKEQGIPSATGQREISQKAASRLARQSKQRERAFVQVGKRLADILRDLKEDGQKLIISSPDNGALHPVDIGEAVSLEPGTFRIDVHAGNLLSRHPSAKREEVKDMAQAGIFTPEEVKALVVAPDVEAAIGKRVDVRGKYAKQIQLAITKGVYSRPERFWPQLELGKTMYQEALFEAQSEKVPELRLKVMRDWLLACKDILDQLAAEQAPPPPPQGAPPPAEAPPAPTPTQGVM